MEVINLNWPLNPDSLDSVDKVIVMGLFDGVHRGHQKVFSEARQIAKQVKLPLAVLTYYPSPSVYFGDSERKLLTTNQEKIDRIAEFEPDYLYITNINRIFLALPPQEFVDRFLLKLNPKIVVAGTDHTYGNKELDADMPHLNIFAKDRFEVVEVGLLTDDTGNKFASTKIRKELATGDIVNANQDLGYSYSISGTVIDGEKVGRTLGFPTVNLKFDENKLIPADGVYVTQTKLGNNSFNSVTSIGTNPTFENRQRTVETYMLDFNQDIYGQNVKLVFFDKIRDQIKFDNLDDLIKKINNDVDFVKKYFQ